MKKVFVALAIINLFSLTCYSIERYTSDQLISRIERASVNFNTTRMKKAWKTLCEQDKTTCLEKEDWYNKLLYDTKVRQHDVTLIRGGFHIKY